MFANFLTAFTNFDCKSVKLLPTRLEGCEAILLPEDSFLAGFYPLLGAPHCSQFVQPPYDKVNNFQSNKNFWHAQCFINYYLYIQSLYSYLNIRQKFICYIESTNLIP